MERSQVQGEEVLLFCEEAYILLTGGDSSYLPLATKPAISNPEVEKLRLFVYSLTLSCIDLLDLFDIVTLHGNDGSDDTDSVCMRYPHCTY